MFYNLNSINEQAQESTNLTSVILELVTKLSHFHGWGGCKEEENSWIRGEERDDDLLEKLSYLYSTLSDENGKRPILVHGLSLYRCVPVLPI